MISRRADADSRAGSRSGRECTNMARIGGSPAGFAAVQVALAGISTVLYVTPVRVRPGRVVEGKAAHSKPLFPQGGCPPVGARVRSVSPNLPSRMSRPPDRATAAADRYIRRALRGRAARQLYVQSVSSVAPLRLAYRRRALGRRERGERVTDPAARPGSGRRAVHADGLAGRRAARRGIGGHPRLVDAEALSTSEPRGRLSRELSVIAELLLAPTGERARAPDGDSTAARAPRSAQAGFHACSRIGRTGGGAGAPLGRALTRSDADVRRDAARSSWPPCARPRGPPPVPRTLQRRRRIRNAPGGAGLAGTRAERRARRASAP